MDFLHWDLFNLSNIVPKTYRVSQKKHSYKIFGLEIMLFTCSQTLWSGLRSSFTKWGTAPAFTTACKTTMSASRWRAWSLVQKFYKSVFSGTPCSSTVWCTRRQCQCIDNWYVISRPFSFSLSVSVTIWQNETSTFFLPGKNTRYTLRIGPHILSLHTFTFSHSLSLSLG